MIWLAAALGLIAISALGITRAGKRKQRGPVPVVSPELAARLAAAAGAFVDAAPWRPAASSDVPATAAAIEAALIAGEPHRALELAEAALAALSSSSIPSASSSATSASSSAASASSSSSAPSSPSARLVSPPSSVAALSSSVSAPSSASSVSPPCSLEPDRGVPARIWLAWALCANGQPRAALDQLAKAGDPTGALAIYVAARAGHLLFEHGHGALGAVPPLITTGDLAVVTLGRGRGSAAWLAGATDVQLSAAQVDAAIAEHREVTARCLAGALAALELAPGFADAAYLAARLAVKAGLITHARALFDALAPRMIGRPDTGAFERDRKDLADPTRAVAAAKQPPLDKGQRSRSLRVLP